ncbi:hypothetical protein OSI00_25875, partial [Mycobacterium ulcerans]
ASTNFAALAGIQAAVAPATPAVDPRSELLIRFIDFGRVGQSADGRRGIGSADLGGIDAHADG